MIDDPSRTKYDPARTFIAGPHAFWKLQSFAWGGFTALIILFCWPDLGTARALSTLLIRMALCILSSLLLRPLCRYVWRRRASFVPLAAAIAALAALSALINEFIAEYFSHIEWGVPQKLIFHSILTASLRYQFVLGAWCIGYFGMKFFIQAERQRDRIQQAGKRRTESMIASFRYQLPHYFLLDMLHQIAQAITGEDSEHASLMIARFAELLSSILEHPDRYFATVAEEIVLAHDYLDLQGMFRRPLPFEFEFIGDVMHRRIPRWFLVPLLDEAFRIAGDRAQSPYPKRLRISSKGTRLRLELIESAPTLDKAEGKTSERFDAIRSLLTLIYDTRASIETEAGSSKPLRVELPLEEEDIPVYK